MNIDFETLSPIDTIEDVTEQDLRDTDWFEEFSSEVQEEILEETVHFDGSANIKILRWPDGVPVIIPEYTYGVGGDWVEKANLKALYHIDFLGDAHGGIYVSQKDKTGYIFVQTRTDEYYLIII